MKTQTLAVDFINIARKAAGVESAANGIFNTLKAEDVKTLDHFNEKVRDAFQANGWSQTAGRPAAGSKEKPAPDAVKLYVSTFRAAYRMKIDVLSFETVGAMRTTIREMRAAAHQRKLAEPPTPSRPEMEGVEVKGPQNLIGALWHDAMLLAEKIPADNQQEMEREVRMVMQRFLRFAPPELTVVPMAA
jgi:hypothetical protein